MCCSFEYVYVYLVVVCDYIWEYVLEMFDEVM